MSSVVRDPVDKFCYSEDPNDIQLTRLFLVDYSTSLFGQAHFRVKGCHNANSIDPDQMLHFAASDLDLCCLPMSLLWGARYKLDWLQSLVTK